MAMELPTIPMVAPATTTEAPRVSVDTALMERERQMLSLAMVVMDLLQSM